MQTQPAEQAQRHRPAARAWITSFICVYILNQLITGVCSSRNIVPVIGCLLSIKLHDESSTDYHVVIETVATMIAVCQHTAFSGIHTLCAAICRLELWICICAHLITSVGSRKRRLDNLCSYAGRDNSTATYEKLQLCADVTWRLFTRHASSETLHQRLLLLHRQWHHV